MIAAGLTGVYAETIPNFEVLTLVVFASGVLLGARDGALVGTVTMLLYSLLNPYGLAHPIVTAAQVAGEAVAGLTGGLAAGLATQPTAVRVAALAGIGAVLTAFYDLLTNLASGLVYGQLRVVLLAGLLFALWHIGTNAALFAIVGTPLVTVCARYRSRLSPAH
jgi:hypothetical protein